MKTPIQQQRILAGQCPLCGKEAAPFRLCYDHRQRSRMDRCIKKGVRTGALEMDILKRIKLAPHDPKARLAWEKIVPSCVSPQPIKGVSRVCTASVWTLKKPCTKLLSVLVVRAPLKKFRRRGVACDHGDHHLWLATSRRSSRQKTSANARWLSEQQFECGMSLTTAPDPQFMFRSLALVSRPGGPLWRI